MNDDIQLPLPTGEVPAPSKKMIQVDAEALRQLLQACVGPPHIIREIQVLHGSKINKLLGDTICLTVLVNQYNTWAAEQVSTTNNETPTTEQPQ